MDQTRIEHYRQRLLAMREELESLAETRADSSSTVELDQTRQGRLSRMDALQGQAMAKAGEERARAGLRRIAAALARCDTGDFGECLECGEAIAEKRLDFDPSVGLCIACAQARED